MERAKKHSVFSTGKAAFVLFAIVVLLIRLWTIRHVPIYVIEHSIHDDRMMVDVAHGLTNGGPNYSQYALVKGWMYPLYLRLIRLLRIPYIQSIHILNAALSILAVFALKEKKIRPFHYIAYVALVFNPAFMSTNVIMRVYRNSFSALMAFAVVIAMIAVYMRRMESKKTIIPWILLACIAWPAFWYTREDSIWLLPFLAYAEASPQTSQNMRYTR